MVKTVDVYIRIVVSFNKGEMTVNGNDQLIDGKQKES